MSLQICEHLKTSELFAQANTVLAYSSVRQEPDLSSLFALDKTWGLPRCVNNNLVWHGWSHEDRPLQPGAFGILEPHPDSPSIAVNTVDLILVPAVACDDQGYRLGYGGGFYDRLLAQPEWAIKPTIGIVFDFARLPQLPRDPWDRSLQFVCTEVGLVEGVGNGG